MLAWIFDECREGLKPCCLQRGFSFVVTGAVILVMAGCGDESTEVSELKETVEDNEVYPPSEDDSRGAENIAEVYRNGNLQNRSTVSYPADLWQYTEEGYLLFERSYFSDENFVLTLSDTPEHTALRILPLDEMCRELKRKYILPVGYEQNNIFLTDWSEENPDGTITLIVNAVYTNGNTSLAYSHKTVIRLLDGDGFQYVSNEMISAALPDGMEGYPEGVSLEDDRDIWWHSNRLTEEEWEEVYGGNTQ